jgi:hypothetical protein
MLDTENDSQCERPSGRRQCELPQGRRRRLSDLPNCDASLIQPKTLRGNLIDEGHRSSDARHLNTSWVSRNLRGNGSLSVSRHNLQ